MSVNTNHLSKKNMHIHTKPLVLRLRSRDDQDISTFHLVLMTTVNKLVLSQPLTSRAREQFSDRYIQTSRNVVKS